MRLILLGLLGLASVPALAAPIAHAECVLDPEGRRETPMKMSIDEVGAIATVKLKGRTYRCEAYVDEKEGGVVEVEMKLLEVNRKDVKVLVAEGTFTLHPKKQPIGIARGSSQRMSGVVLAKLP